MPIERPDWNFDPPTPEPVERTPGTPITRPNWGTDEPPDTAPAATPAVAPQDEDIDNEDSDVDDIEDEDTEEEVAPTPSTPSITAVEAALAEIAGLRRSNRRAYFSDESLQQRERELLAMRDQLQAAPEEGDAAIGPELIEEWQDAGGVAHHLAELQGTAQSVLDGVDPTAQEAFTASFDALPQTVQHQVYRHLAVAPSGVARAASAEIVKEFAGESDERAALAAEWGDEAPQKLGLVRARTAAILSGLSDDDRAAAVEWLDELPETTIMAVVKALSKK